MLSRFITNSARHLRFFSFKAKPIFSTPHFHTSPSIYPTPLSRFPQFPIFPSTHLTSHSFSTNNGNNDENNKNPTSDLWDVTPKDDNFIDVFGKNNVSHSQDASWPSGVGQEKDDKEVWSLDVEAKIEDVFDLGGVEMAQETYDGLQLHEKKVNTEDDLKLQEEEQALMAVLEGPNRAFGDLVAASGITDAMLDSLIALKDFKNIEGLPPLAEIEDQRYENSLKKSSRYEMELQKQEEAAKARVRQVDEKGRAYGTGRRKCSIARVWIQPGEGKFFINDKEFDVYFPMLDHRAALLRPFAETKTLGLWDVKCTVKGGGVSGQVGAIRLGISRALQNWEPGLRPPLREAGFLTRDPRVVERKKPGKAKARKSFQWVKR